MSETSRLCVRLRHGVNCSCHRTFAKWPILKMQWPDLELARQRVMSKMVAGLRTDMQSVPDLEIRGSVGKAILKNSKAPPDRVGVAQGVSS